MYDLFITKILILYILYNYLIEKNPAYTFIYINVA